MGKYALPEYKWCTKAFLRQWSKRKMYKRIMHAIREVFALTSMVITKTNVFKHKHFFFKLCCDYVITYETYSCIASVAVKLVYLPIITMITRFLALTGLRVIVLFA